MSNFIKKITFFFTIIKFCFLVQVTILLLTYPNCLNALIVSGGNTQLIYFEKIGKYRIIGETKDDAAGECFDKTARILGLNYPGGPEISKKAKECKSNIYNITPPRPMINDKNYDFSFSGLKTAVLYHSKKNKIRGFIFFLILKIR